ncbi:MAG: NADH-quinone oxidoreductase subunit M, partial [Verrucomicrobia bacterium]|nr:NADH-quinone oxidoreductase subunit M [Verrucomicrobiota bacterium]
MACSGSELFDHLHKFREYIMILLCFFLFPLIASVVIMCLGGVSARTLKIVTASLSVVPLLMQLTTAVSLGMEYYAVWFSALSIHFHLSLDYLSEVFLYITNVIVPIGILSASTVTRPNFFYGLILAVQALLIGFFTAQDLVCFTLFFEGMLWPIYFLISAWGGEKRKQASFTFILYMIAGSVFMIAAVLLLYVSIHPGTFDIRQIATFAEKLPFAPLLAAAFLLAFLVKTPLFPFHAWLPNAYCEAPLPATILLSAVLSKTGIYGIARVSTSFFPTLLAQWSLPLMCIAIIGMLYGAFAAWGQTNFKRLIAYSSLSHVNFILAGIVATSYIAQSGAILQAVNHSITIAGLFLVAAWLEERLGSSQFGTVSGLASYMPSLAWLTLFFVLSAVALPGLNNFVSEVLVLYGIFVKSPMLSFLLGTTVILSVIYMLRFMHSVYFNDPVAIEREWTDIRAREKLIALPLVALILWLGLYPGPVITRISQG